MGFIDTLTTKGPIEDSRIDYFPDAVPRDCVLYLPLARNRLRGDTFRSLDSYRHLCTVTGAVWTPQGRAFDGDDFVAVQPADPGTKYTVLAWCKVSDYTISRTLFAGGNVDSYTPDFAIHNDGKVRGVSNGANQYLFGNTVLQTGRAYLAGYTVSGKNNHIWLNGQSDSDVEARVNNPGVWATTHFLGKRTVAGIGFFIGTIGPVYVFDRALTPQEIQRIYLATKDRYQ